MSMNVAHATGTPHDSKSFREFAGAHRLASTVVCSALLGALIFIGIYGVAILNPTYDDWVRNAAGDFSQSYYGWRFFRESQWHWPLGLMDGVAYPELTPIMYIDSVPLFNVIFKVLSPILPATFQFFGLWGLTCFMLDGALGGALVYRFTGNALFSTIGSVFFTMTTFSIQRLYTHTALAANWVILLCMVVIVYQNRERDTWYRQLGLWFLTFFLAVSVNMYYVPIIGIMMVMNCLYLIISSRKIINAAVALVSSLVGTAFAFYLYGGFYHLSSGVPSQDNFGQLGANLNALFNPMETGLYLTGASRFMKTQPQTTLGQYEGYAYLGFGLIILAFITLAGLLTVSHEKVRQWWAATKTEFLVTLGTVILLVIAAVGPNVTVNSRTLFTIPYPVAFIKLYGIFRSMGRFMWGVWDIMALLVLVTVFATFSRKVAAIVVSICLAVQIADLSPMWQQRHKTYAHRQNAYVATIDATSLDVILDGKQHVTTISGDMLNPQFYYDIAQEIIPRGITINDFYYSRTDSTAINAYRAQIQQNLAQGIADNDTAYVFNSFSDAEPYQGLFNLYYVDGLIWGTTSPVAGLQRFSMSPVDGVQVHGNTVTIPDSVAGGTIALQVNGADANLLQAQYNGQNVEDFPTVTDSRYKRNTLLTLSEGANTLTFSQNLDSYEIKVYAVQQ